MTENEFPIAFIVHNKGWQYEEEGKDAEWKMIDTEISDFDLDFIVENGSDYNWDETNARDFESNLEYLLNKIKEIKDDNEVVQVFIEEWMRRDSNYYNEYSYDTITDDDGNVLVISLAAITNQ